RGDGAPGRLREAEPRDRLGAEGLVGGRRPPHDRLVRSEPRQVDRTRRLADAGATRDALTRHGALAAGALCLVFLAVAVAAIRAAANVAGAPEFPVAGSPISAPGDWEHALRWGVIGAFLAYAAGILLLARWAADVRAVLGLAVAIQLVPLFAPL